MISYLLVRTCILFFKLIPFWLINKLSFLLKFILSRVIKYRRKTLISNINYCFPNLNKKELQDFISSNYQNLSTITLESIKGLSLSGNEIMRRNPIKGLETVRELLNKNKSLILVCPHYYNWEWTVLSSAYHLPERVIGIYKAIRNPYLEKFVYSLRSRSSIHLIKTWETRRIIEEIPKGRAILLMLDQYPYNTDKAIWVNFFGQKIPVIHGLEKYSREFGLPVYYLNQRKLKESYYEVTVEELVADPSELKENQVTELFISKVEAVIRNNPAPWLWTHRRWKHLRP
ncbi:MAG: lysophospholipid acyltransferase family protein [Saprospiraceae bacterium]|nr:lysophospholipid acyltransferase family protein [Saprospiraceae bacterium]